MQCKLFAIFHYYEKTKWIIIVFSVVIRKSGSMWSAYRNEMCKSLIQEEHSNPIVNVFLVVNE